MDQINATIRKFGYPDTLLGNYRHWVVLLRPGQVTLGSMVLACKGNAQKLSEVSAAAYGELPQASADLEAALAASLKHDKINYLLLMMVDPQVHFHVIPRYAAAREIDGRSFEDAFWPGPPDVRQSLDLEADSFAALQDLLRQGWPKV